LAGLPTVPGRNVSKLSLAKSDNLGIKTPERAVSRGIALAMTHAIRPNQKSANRMTQQLALTDKFPGNSNPFYPGSTKVKLPGK